MKITRPWLRLRRPKPKPVPRDIEGVTRAEAELEHSTRQLEYDQANVIMPLRREAYRNNIQQLVVALLRPGPRPRPDDGGSHAHSAR